MVYISPHCLHPSSNWQVMHRCFSISSPPSLLFFSFINGRHSGVVVMAVEVIVALGLALFHVEAQCWHFIQQQVLLRCSFHEHLLCFSGFSFFSLRLWKVNQSWNWYRRPSSIWLWLHPTPIPLLCHTDGHTHTHTRKHTEWLHACLHPHTYCKCVFSNIHHSTSHWVTLQCWSFFPSPTHNQPGSLFYSLSAQVTAKHNNTPADICLS